MTRSRSKPPAARSRRVANGPVHDSATARSHYARNHPELAAGGCRRNVRGHAQDGDELDHLRSVRHGNRHHGREGRHRVLRRGNSRFHRCSRQVGEIHRRQVRPAGRRRAGRRFRHQRSVLRGRHAPQRHRRDDARVPRRTADRLDRQHRAPLGRGGNGAGIAHRRGHVDFPGGPAASRDQDHLAGTDHRPGDAGHQGQFAHAGRARRRSLGRHRLGKGRGKKARRACRGIRHGHVHGRRSCRPWTSARRRP